MTYVNKGFERSPHSRASDLVERWLRAEYTIKDGLKDEAFLGEPILMHMFAYYNTAVPSSASVERLFSRGRDILTAKRNRLNDENLESLIFLKRQW